MRGKVYLALAVLAGAGGFALRRWADAAAFDAGTGLALTGAAAYWALVAFLLAVLVLGLILGLCTPRGGVDFSDAFEGGSMAGGMLALLSGTAVAVSGLLALWQYVRGQGGKSLLVLGPVMLIAGLGMIRLAALDQESRGRGYFCLASLLPGFACCAWLVLFYRTHANIPAVMSYAVALLAILASALAFYAQAAFYFDRPRPRLGVFSGFAAAVLTVAAIPGCDLLYEKVLLGGLCLWMLRRTYQIASAAVPAQEVKPEPAPEADEPPARPARRPSPSAWEEEPEANGRFAIPVERDGHRESSLSAPALSDDAPPRETRTEPTAGDSTPQQKAPADPAHPEAPQMPPMPKKLDLSFLDDLFADTPGWADKLDDEDNETKQ